MKIADVVSAMSTLKSLFGTEELVADTFGSEEKQADLKRAKDKYQQAVENYHSK